MQLFITNVLAQKLYGLLQRAQENRRKYIQYLTTSINTPRRNNRNKWRQVHDDDGDDDDDYNSNVI
jgi:hypothetical protein